VRLFLFAIGATDRASSRLRVWDHVDWLRGQGDAVSADSEAPPGAKAVTISYLARLSIRYPVWIARFLKADAIVIQESLALWPLLLVKNLGKRRRVLFDFSDPIDRIGRGFRRRVRRRLIGLVMRRADAVMVENKLYLERVSRLAPRALHFYGPVDSVRYAAARKRSPQRDGALRMGWTGSPGTFPLIAPLLPAIDSLAREQPIELFLIGAGRIKHELAHARLTVAEWREDSEFELVSTFDLGLFRLDGSEDSRWRGAGKLFIYMAAGVPFVASDHGIAATLMRESGIGFAVPDDNRWLDVLRSAAADAHVRRDFAERSVRFARDNLSYELYRSELARQLRAEGQEEER
jgi:glycosyltransferase involved in cell wall biosynthesis